MAQDNSNGFFGFKGLSKLAVQQDVIPDYENLLKNQQTQFPIQDPWQEAQNVKAQRSVRFQSNLNQDDNANKKSLSEQIHEQLKGQSPSLD